MFSSCVCDIIRLSMLRRTIMADMNQTIDKITNTADYTDSFHPQDIAQNKAMAILAYLGILVLIPIFAAKNSAFAKFHANQGLILHRRSGHRSGMRSAGAHPLCGCCLPHHHVDLRSSVRRACHHGAGRRDHGQGQRASVHRRYLYPEVRQTRKISAPYSLYGAFF